ncbi:hypothetical protein AB4Y30_02480 [Ornithinibacillus sp. 4-3]|uniref:Uncharacterized protein n=1 Tax=Ornithinibacillus sp. 4-3 TaxID=3231488 RepID=A0AB39HSF2_9BACI
MNNENQLYRSTSEDEGISSKAILSFLDAVEEENLNYISFMLVRNDKVIAEGA